MNTYILYVWATPQIRHTWFFIFFVHEFFLSEVYEKFPEKVYRLIKSRLQMSEDKEQKKMGVLEYMKKIIKSEGVGGLYSGLNSKQLQSVLSSAFLFYAKEMLFDWSVWLLLILGTRKSMQ